MHGRIDGNTIAIQLEWIAQRAKQSSDASKYNSSTSDTLDQAVTAKTAAAHRYQHEASYIM